MNAKNYWETRNKLVDKVLALTPRDCIHIAFAERTPEQQARVDAYGAALDELKAFDLVNGGSPIL